MFMHRPGSPEEPVADVRDIIFSGVRNRIYRAQITACAEGILSGMDGLKAACRELGLRLAAQRKAGSRLRPGDAVAVVEGTAKQIAMAEERLIGWVSKASGIATAARGAERAAGGGMTVVCGAWKKMPPPLKDLIRRAVTDGGIPCRMAEPPFLYLDKNYIRILGGVERALRAARACGKRTRVVQLKSGGVSLRREAVAAARAGGDILMVDTGRPGDIEIVDAALRAERLRRRVRIAFSGNVGLHDLADLSRRPVDLVEIGHAVVDAPLLDMRMDVVGAIGGSRGPRTV